MTGSAQGGPAFRRIEGKGSGDARQQEFGRRLERAAEAGSTSELVELGEQFVEDNPKTEKTQLRKVYGELLAIQEEAGDASEALAGQLQMFRARLAYRASRIHALEPLHSCVGQAIKGLLGRGVDSRRLLNSLVVFMEAVVAFRAARER